jgi:hypothetical protein
VVVASSAKCSSAGECLILFGITTIMIGLVAVVLIGGITLFTRLRDRR